MTSRVNDGLTRIVLPSRGRWLVRIKAVVGRLRATVRMAVLVRSVSRGRTAAVASPRFTTEVRRVS